MARFSNMPPSIEIQVAAIASSATTSDAINLAGMNLVGLVMPAAFTGTTVTFQASVDGTNYFDVYNTAGTQLSVTVGTSQYICLWPSDLASIKNLKLVSGATEAAARSITLVMRSL
jgi:hypothetical protein